MAGRLASTHVAKFWTEVLELTMQTRLASAGDKELGIKACVHHHPLLLEGRTS